MADRGTGLRGGFWQTMGLVVLAVLTVALCFLALTRDMSSGTDVAADPGSSASPSGDATVTDEPTDGTSESAEPSTSPTAAPSQDPPTVKDLRNADFSKGADLPDGSQTYDNPSVGSPLELADDVLTHGAPTAKEAISSLETKLGGDVQKLSARIVFADENPGSVVLVAWQDSLVDARNANKPVPDSGLRLVVTAGSWQLTAYQTTAKVLAEGTYAAEAGPATFTLIRKDDIAWVEDPTGKVTQVQDPRIAELAGPFACWQLYEQETDQVPAQLEAVSAG